MGDLLDGGPGTRSTSDYGRVIEGKVLADIANQKRREQRQEESRQALPELTEKLERGDWLFSPDRKYAIILESGTPTLYRRKVGFPQAPEGYRSCGKKWMSHGFSLAHLLDILDEERSPRQEIPFPQRDEWS